MRRIDLPAAAVVHRSPVVQALVRTTLATGAILLGYFLLPADRTMPGFAPCAQAAGLVCVAALLGRRVRTILRGAYPRLRTLEAFALAVPAFVILFAGRYFYIERHAAADFNVPLTRLDALYFTVSVLSVVGFGDIVARSEPARMIVTVQMLGDLILLGAAARIVIYAVNEGIHWRPAPAASAPEPQAAALFARPAPPRAESPAGPPAGSPQSGV